MVNRYCSWIIEHAFQTLIGLAQQAQRATEFRRIQFVFRPFRQVLQEGKIRRTQIPGFLIDDAQGANLVPV